jgi:hypothetical protein
LTPISKFQDTLSEDGSKVKNVDHEYPIYFSVMDEHLSWYLDKNIKEFTSDPGSVDKEDEDFIESNKMNIINGRIYGNLKGLSMVQGQTINWYLLSLGTEVDMHNVHFHGQTVLAVSRTWLVLHLSAIWSVFHEAISCCSLQMPSDG